MHGLMVVPRSRSQLVNKKILIDVIGLELIALVVVIGYKLSPILLPQADLTVQPDPVCNLQREACRVTLPAGGQVELRMGTHPVPLVKPFEVAVTTSGFSPTRVDVDFAGIDMNMGLNRPQLMARQPGEYSAEATLPVCISGHMDWQATVLIETGRERIAIPYRFSTVEHNF